jgi:hypothetical protein
MKGYKDSTKTIFTKGGPKGGVKGAARTAQAMKCFKEGGRVLSASQPPSSKSASC